MHCCENRTDTQNADARIDPVCGMEVKDADRKRVIGYNGRNYYFCAETCMKKFKQTPERFADAGRVPRKKKKGLWGRYLDRLNKVTGGKEVKCH